MKMIINDQSKDTMLSNINELEVIPVLFTHAKERSKLYIYCNSIFSINKSPKNKVNTVNNLRSCGCLGGSVGEAFDS